MPQAHQKYKTAQECPFHPEKLWQWIPGFEQRYMVSSCGDIRMHLSFCGRGMYICDPPRVLRQIVHKKNGYVTIQFQTQKQRQAFYVHRLTLQAFTGDAPEAMECGHLDGNRQHNHLSNLAWVTRKENLSHCHQHGTCHCGEGNPMAKLTHEQVQAIRLAAAQGERQWEIGERYGIRQDTVSLIVNRINWAHS